MLDPNTRAALLFTMRRRSEGLSLRAIVEEVITSYALHKIDVDPPKEFFPDAVAEWVSMCWEHHGPHPVFPDIHDKRGMVIPLKRKKAL